MLNRLGFERCVIVQAGCHGFDNSVVADALAAKGGAYVGVALLRPEVKDAELKALDAQGFRGVRFNFMKHLPQGASIEEILRGPAHENDGTFNLFGALATSMATTGYASIKEFQKAEVMVAPALKTEGKVLQREQGIGMGR